MNTEKIKNVILYAKNFYAHSENVIADCRKYMIMDGHNPLEIASDEKVLGIMQNDFIDFANSCGENRYKIMKNLGKSVAWADGIEGKIWNIILVYDIYVPLYGKFTGYPKYDEDHKPQFNITNKIFNGRNFDVCTTQAKAFLDSTQRYWLDVHFNRLMVGYDFVTNACYFSNLGDNVTEHELWNEVEELYEDFVVEHEQNDGFFPSDCFTLQSKHFVLELNLENFGVDLTLQTKYKTTEFKTKNQDTYENTVENLFKQLYNNAEQFSNVFDKFKATFNGEMQDETDKASLIKFFNDCKNSIIEHKEHFGHSVTFQTGKFLFKITEDEAETTMQVSVVLGFACECRENALDSCCYTYGDTKN